jgi:hypothetical protein
MADDDLSRLTQDEKTALAALLKRTIDADCYSRIGQSERNRLQRHKQRGALSK